MITYNRFFAVASIVTIVGLFATATQAAEMPAASSKAPKCSIVYINGDAVIACKRAPIVVSEVK